MQFHSTFSAYWQIDFRYENKKRPESYSQRNSGNHSVLTTVVKAHSFDEAAPGSIIYISAHLIL